ncbi:hypothetical protein CEXT_301731 [Caerostris extrusa]|uniref:Uncharacterized protein n=1 Tax=Caerostris extrusa TaxID=172846 RepID=A0AAV4S6J3_CAEEX|nr:hypothetical protein CEXT_301731 [Caerostris extrusa]
MGLWLPLRRRFSLDEAPRRLESGFATSPLSVSWYNGVAFTFRITKPWALRISCFRLELFDRSTLGMLATFWYYWIQTFSFAPTVEILFMETDNEGNGPSQVIDEVPSSALLTNWVILPMIRDMIGQSRSI